MRWLVLTLCACHTAQSFPDAQLRASCSAIVECVQLTGTFDETTPKPQQVRDCIGEGIETPCIEFCSFDPAAARDCLADIRESGRTCNTIPIERCSEVYTCDEAYTTCLESQ